MVENRVLVYTSTVNEVHQISSSLRRFRSESRYTVKQRNENPSPYNKILFCRLPLYRGYTNMEDLQRGVPKCKG